MVSRSDGLDETSVSQALWYGVKAFIGFPPSVSIVPGLTIVWS